MAVLRPCLLLLLGVLVMPAMAAEVHNLRVWASPDSTRAVLDLDEQVDYRIFTLSDPERLVVDIQNVRTSGELPFDPDAGGVIAGVRHGVRNGSDLRVVFDLKGRAEPQSFVLDPAGRYGHRLVIDLVPEGVPTPNERVREVARAARTGKRDMIVAIDAGHGGEDPGAIGPGGTYEKKITLAIARELESQINDLPGMRAVMIRTGDYFVPLRERYERARQAQADLLLSVHADAFRDFRVRGSSVYVLSRSGASSEAARLLAQSENEADLIGGVKLDRGDDMLSSVLLDLSQSAALEYSNDAAEQILQRLGSVGRRHRSNVERANFVVLRSPDVPSVLLEVGFISNPDDEKNLNTAAHRRQVATAIVAGVRDHFLRTAPQGTWIAANRSGKQHVVQRGDTLGVIAQRYQVSVSTIRAANNISGDVIHPGAVLVIPAGS
ncbi:MAG: N-acetylmuramoyl-L-alanine amidase [Wenzhouxiangella sp.]|nr:N-acetylmuramoyl-L-alanine amidase [Wenzhouxiangella sp.]